MRIPPTFSIPVTITLCMLALWPPIARADSGIVYDDTLADNWGNWSWTQPAPDFMVRSPVHSGSYSIGVTYGGGWQGLQLHYPGFPTHTFSKLRFFIHGGSSGGQRYRVYIVREGESERGPEIRPSPPLANQWTEVQIPLGELGAENTSITHLVWQDDTGHAQPTFYLDDIAFVSEEHPDGPRLREGDITPRATLPGRNNGLSIGVRVSDPQGAADIASVTVDATALGLGTILLRDDGRSNDGSANDGRYGAIVTIPADASRAEHVLVARASDRAGHQTVYSLGALAVLAGPPGAIPPALPQPIGLGTNEWSRYTGQDWQVNSGVPWNYVYQWITWDWYVNGWGGNFVGNFVNQAWDKGYIPIVSVYLVLGATGCPEDPVCYADRLKNSITVRNYFQALTEAARQANGSDPVIFHLEMDFYGFMQQLSNQPDRRPSGVRQDDPSSYYVALNTTGYPNNLAGFGRRMVDVIRAHAPNALVAPHASDWSTNKSAQIVPAGEIVDMAQRTAHFIDAMGGDQADLLFTEWSDRDAGSGQRPWWDVTNRTLPRPTRETLWDNALSTAAGKRLILWMMPCGNMSLNNTCERYQDNRAEYAFRHLQDFMDAGFVGITFGPGAACMTRPQTDGGMIKNQATVTYALPSAPGGLSGGMPIGPSVPIRWNESAEPDLKGYKVTYEPAEGGTRRVADVGRANSTTLLLPVAGSWRVGVAAYDALGQVGPSSSSITVTTYEAPKRRYLPLVQAAH